MYSFYFFYKKLSINWLARDSTGLGYSSLTSRELGTEKHSKRKIVLENLSNNMYG